VEVAVERGVVVQFPAPRRVACGGGEHVVIDSSDEELCGYSVAPLT
jgi:hypothetical protein